MFSRSVCFLTLNSDRHTSCAYISTPCVSTSKPGRKRERFFPRYPHRKALKCPGAAYSSPPPKLETHRSRKKLLCVQRLGCCFRSAAASDHHYRGDVWGGTAAVSVKESSCQNKGIFFIRIAKHHLFVIELSSPAELLPFRYCRSSQEYAYGTSPSPASVLSLFLRPPAPRPSFREYMPIHENRLYVLRCRPPQ